MLEQFQHRVCVIDFDEGEDSSLVARKLREGCDASVALFAASNDSRPDQIIGAMRAGRSEFLTKPFHSDQVVEALSQLQLNRPGNPLRTKRAKSSL